MSDERNTANQPLKGPAAGAPHEDSALLALQTAGLKLIARNCRYRSGEIDLVMEDGDGLVFVEVRFRRHSMFGGGAASVDRRKQQKLISAATQYLAEHPQFSRRPCRFDVVAVSADPKAPIDWIRDAFRVGD